MKRRKMQNVRQIGNEFITEEELRETMYGVGRYSWCTIHKHLCTEEGCMFPLFAESVWALSEVNRELSFALLCIMLKEAGEQEFVTDLKAVCHEDELAMDCFVDSFTEGFEMFLHEGCVLCDREGYDGGDDTEEECLEEPALEISIRVREDFVAGFQNMMEMFFKNMEMPVPDFMEEAEDDE